VIPIYEQGIGNGIGHGLQSFLERFDSICAKHLAAGRAKTFAFIFYDFTDDNFRKILKNQGVFARLDRLSGTNLSIFYLHRGTRHAVKAFNDTFMKVLGVEEQALPPCVVFFRVHEGQIEDVEIAQLDNADLIHGFNELYGSVEQYIKVQPRTVDESTALKWFKGSSKFIGLELFRAALKKAFEFAF
jgi:hypothetical protein